jgi:type VI protein secretion system component Hcp
MNDERSTIPEHDQVEDLDVGLVEAELVSGGATSAPGGGKVQMQDFNFVKKVDKSSPL